MQAAFTPRPFLFLARIRIRLKNDQPGLLRGGRRWRRRCRNSCLQNGRCRREIGDHRCSFSDMPASAQSLTTAELNCDPACRRLTGEENLRHVR
eukprot:4543152-Prymnesium_polylepis.1